MKKIFFMLIATVCVAGVYAQNMQIWTDDDIMYEQSVATIDSITFTDADAPAQEGTLYKTWEGATYSGGTGELSGYTINITFSSNYTFSSNIYGMMSTGNYIIQGNIILLCKTSGNGLYLPTCLVYYNGKLYGGFGELGSIELH